MFVNISSISVTEYLFGIYYLFGNNTTFLQKKLLSAEEDLARFHCLEINYSIAKLAGQINAELKRTGKIIDYGDVLIAATAKYYDLRLITRNYKHFSRIEGLQIETY